MKNIVCKSIIINSAILCLMFCLSSCQIEGVQKQQTNKNQAIEDAKAPNHETHLDYLQCYALNHQEKKDCVKKLTNKYIEIKFRENIHYTSSFQYEAEKQGFIQFLKNKGRPCDSIKSSPKYVLEIESYVVKCNNINISAVYLLRFDYEKKEWNIVK